MNTSQYIGFLRAEFMSASERTAIGAVVPSKEEYISLSTLAGILETFEEVLNKNFVSKERVAEVLATECNIGNVLEAMGLEIAPKDPKDKEIMSLLNFFQPNK